MKKIFILFSIFIFIFNTQIYAVLNWNKLAKNTSSEYTSPRIEEAKQRVAKLKLEEVKKERTIDNIFFKVKLKNFTDDKLSSKIYYFQDINSDFNINIVISEHNPNSRLVYSQEELEEMINYSKAETNNIIEEALLKIEKEYPELLLYYSKEQIIEEYINYSFENVSISTFNNYKCFKLENKIFNNTLTQYIFDSDNYMYTITVTGDITENYSNYKLFENTFEIKDKISPIWWLKTKQIFLNPETIGKVLLYSFIGSIIATIEFVNKNKKQKEQIKKDAEIDSAINDYFKNNKE